jgi:hypothetical protein
VRGFEAGLLDHGRQVAPPLRDLDTAVSEDELIIVNPCRINGAGEAQATEWPVLTLTSSTPLSI